jgi:LysM repeat protein
MNPGLQGAVILRAPVTGAPRAGEDEQHLPSRRRSADVRPSRLLFFCIAFLIPSATANAAVPHTVQPGETLWSIAAANNLTTRTVAAYNGLSEDAQVVLGSTIQVPTTTEGYSALQQQGFVPADPAAAPAAAPASSSGGGYTVQLGDTLSSLAAQTGTTVDALAAANGLDPNGLLVEGTVLNTSGQSGQAAAAPSGAPAPLGGYTVRLGDTLSSLAAQAGVTVDAMAAMNGLDPNGLLVEGTVLKLPSGAPAPAAASEPAPAEVVVPQAAPEPSPGFVSAADVQSVANLHGVSPSLAAAIAYQESGFNNAMVSSANARGVMQVMPGTWDYVQQNLAGRPLDPNSPTDNVHAGVMYLKRLLTDAGGDENAAIAGYYQGLRSVQDRGMFDDTKQYVDNVQALRGRFGG